VQYRSTQGGNTSQVLAAGAIPAFIEIARWTDATSGVTYFTTYTSQDGAGWTPVPQSTVTLSMPQPLLAGIATDSYNQGTAATVTMDSVAITAQEFCSVGGWNCEDIGGATPAGSQTRSNGIWSIFGGGGDIWGTADSFRYVWRSPATVNAVSARITSQGASDPWAKAGVMVRLSSDAGSPYYAVFMTPGHGVAVQWRAAQGGASSQVLTAGGLPLYLKITVSGTTFTAFTSTDGTTWTAVPGSAQNLVNLNGLLLAGIAVTSHNTGSLSATTFDTVATN